MYDKLLLYVTPSLQALLTSKIEYYYYLKNINNSYCNYN